MAEQQPAAPQLVREFPADEAQKNLGFQRIFLFGRDPATGGPQAILTEFVETVGDKQIRKGVLTLGDGKTDLDPQAFIKSLDELKKQGITIPEKLEQGIREQAKPENGYKKVGELPEQNQKNLIAFADSLNKPTTPIAPQPGQQPHNLISRPMTVQTNPGKPDNRTYSLEVTELDKDNGGFKTLKITPGIPGAKPYLITKDGKDAEPNNPAYAHIADAPAAQQADLNGIFARLNQKPDAEILQSLTAPASSTQEQQSPQSPIVTPDAGRKTAPVSSRTGRTLHVPKHQRTGNRADIHGGHYGHRRPHHKMKTADAHRHPHKHPHGHPWKHHPERQHQRFFLDEIFALFDCNARPSRKAARVHTPGFPSGGG
jgi:hypothetical protein